jgi:hypothetical protein
MLDSGEFGRRNGHRQKNLAQSVYLIPLLPCVVSYKPGYRQVVLKTINREKPKLAKQQRWQKI